MDMVRKSKNGSILNWGDFFDFELYLQALKCEMININ